MSTVYLIGAGPGDPGLITVKGFEYLKTCDAVIYDRLVSEQLLRYLKQDCVRIYVGKEQGRHSETQEEINRILVESAGQYEKIVRLKGGDPFVFGRGGEEIEELIRHRIPYEVVPGVTSAVAVPSVAGIPVTHRGVSQSFHVITGHTSDTKNALTDNYEILARLQGTLVFLMGLSNLEQITEQLLCHGKAADTPAAVISDGTGGNERTIRGNLKDIAGKVRAADIPSPAVFVVGGVAALEFKQTYDKPLRNISIGITGTLQFRRKLEQGLAALGARVTTVCDLQVQETDGIFQLAEELKHLTEYQWIIFTSANAIHIFFETMQKHHIDRRKLGHIRFAVIGSGTGHALEQYGYLADFMPESFTSGDLAAKFAARAAAEKDRVLIPRAQQGSEELAEILRSHNIDFTELLIYDIRSSQMERKEDPDVVDCLVFASASGVNAFFEAQKETGLRMSENTVIACIGGTTEAALSGYHKNAQIVARVSSAEGLIDEIVRYYIRKLQLGNANEEE